MRVVSFSLAFFVAVTCVGALFHVYAEGPSDRKCRAAPTQNCVLELALAASEDESVTRRLRGHLAVASVQERFGDPAFERTFFDAVDRARRDSENLAAFYDSMASAHCVDLWETHASLVHGPGVARLLAVELRSTAQQLLSMPNRPRTFVNLVRNWQRAVAGCLGLSGDAGGLTDWFSEQEREGASRYLLSDIGKNGARGLLLGGAIPEARALAARLEDPSDRDRIEAEIGLMMIDQGAVDRAWAMAGEMRAGHPQTDLLLAVTTELASVGRCEDAAVAASDLRAVWSEFPKTGGLRPDIPKARAELAEAYVVCRNRSGLEAILSREGGPDAGWSATIRAGLALVERDGELLRSLLPDLEGILDTGDPLSGAIAAYRLHGHVDLEMLDTQEHRAFLSGAHCGVAVAQMEEGDVAGVLESLNQMAVLRGERGPHPRDHAVRDFAVFLTENGQASHAIELVSRQMVHPYVGLAIIAEALPAAP